MVGPGRGQSGRGYEWKCLTRGGVVFLPARLCFVFRGFNPPGSWLDFCNANQSVNQVVPLGQVLLAVRTYLLPLSACLPAAMRFFRTNTFFLFFFVSSTKPYTLLLCIPHLGQIYTRRSSTVTTYIDYLVPHPAVVTIRFVVQDLRSTDLQETCMYVLRYRSYIEDRE